MCAIPCASVSAKRTRTSVSKWKSTARQSLRSRSAARRADPQRQPCRLTGAGVSTESGIPDFRSPTGSGRSSTRSSTARSSLSRRPAQGLELLQAARRDADRGRAERAHLALAELERLGFVEAVVTQNIDLLHERAGSREVVEVQARSAARPARAAESAPLERVLELLAEAERTACPCGRLKPDVVFFGELLRRSDRPGSQLARGQAAARRRLGARGLPGGGLPETLAPAARSRS